MVKDTDGITVWSDGPRKKCDPGSLMQAWNLKLGSQTMNNYKLSMIFIFIRFIFSVSIVAPIMGR